jgi:hypothetical protein
MPAYGMAGSDYKRLMHSICLMQRVCAYTLKEYGIAWRSHGCKSEESRAESVHVLEAYLKYLIAKWVL